MATKSEEERAVDEMDAELHGLSEVTKTTADLIAESASSFFDTVQHLDRMSPVDMMVKMPAAVVSTQFEMAGIAFDWWSDLIWSMAVRPGQ